MIFESDRMKVIQPLDPYQGPRYTEQTYENMEEDAIDQLYSIIVWKWDDYINPIVDGSVISRSVQSAGEDFEDTFND